LCRRHGPRRIAPQEDAQVVQGMEDLGRMMPADIKAGTTTFKKSEVWAGVAKGFAAPAGKKVLGALGAKQAAYVKTLLGM
jgi:hypothetical protein